MNKECNNLVHYAHVEEQSSFDFLISACQWYIFEFTHCPSTKYSTDHHLKSKSSSYLSSPPQKQKQQLWFSSSVPISDISLNLHRPIISSSPPHFFHITLKLMKILRMMHATMLHNAIYIQQRIFPTYRYIYKVITLLKVIVMWGLKYDRRKKSKDCKVVPDTAQQSG